MQGYVSLKIGWSTSQDGVIQCPKHLQKFEKDADLEVTQGDIFRDGNLDHWTESAQVDPNDPHNANLLHAAKVSFHRK